MALSLFKKKKKKSSLNCSASTPLKTAYKDCGHNECYLDNSAVCCECGDKRPLRTSYEEYVEGKGFVKTTFRHANYCSGCKNRVSSNSEAKLKQNSNSNFSSSSSSSASNFNATEPFCPHSVLPKVCAMCTTEIEQHAIKDAVMRFGYSLNHVVEVSKRVPHKDKIKSVQIFLQILLEMLEQEDIKKKQPVSSTTPSRAQPKHQTVPNTYAPNDQNSGLYPCVASSTNQDSQHQTIQTQRPPLISLNNLSYPLLQPTAFSSPDLHSTTAVQTPSAPMIAEECKVCFDATVNSILVPCGHRALCFNCALNIINTHKSCPMCRMEVDTAIQIFKPDM